MSPPFETEEKEEVWDVMQAINKAWVEGRPDDLDPFFHEDMVIVAPDFRSGARGKEACIRSYRDFCSRATIHDFQEDRPEVEVFDSTAVVSYAFEISHEADGKIRHDRGRDLFIFVQDRDQWQAVWRTLLPVAEEASESQNV